VRTCSLLPLKGRYRNTAILHVAGRSSARPPFCKKALTIKVQPNISGNKQAERQRAAGLGPLRISSSKDQQNKHSLLPSAYKDWVNLPCSNRMAAPQAMSQLQHLGGDHILNESKYKTPTGRAVPGAKGGLLVPTSPPAVPSVGETETPGNRAGRQRSWKQLLQMGSERRGSSTEKGRSEREETPAGIRTRHSEWCSDRRMLSCNVAAKFQQLAVRSGWRAEHGS